MQHTVRLAVTLPLPGHTSLLLFEIETLDGALEQFLGRTAPGIDKRDMTVSFVLTELTIDFAIATDATLVRLGTVETVPAFTCPFGAIFLVGTITTIDISVAAILQRNASLGIDFSF